MCCRLAGSVLYNRFFQSCRTRERSTSQSTILVHESALHKVVPVKNLKHCLNTKREKLQQDLESINSLQITIWLTYRQHRTSKSSPPCWLKTFYPYCVNRRANENNRRYILTRLTLSTAIKMLA